jgi:hypothetical protein
MTRMVCYNVQSAVETKHHLIVAHEVTNTPDRGHLCSTAVKAQSALGRSDITVLADKGYYSGPDIKDTMDAGMTVLVPKGDTSGSEKKVSSIARSLNMMPSKIPISVQPNKSRLID